MNLTPQTACNEFANGSNCQARIVSLEGDVSNVNIYDLSTIGTLSMIDRDGASLAGWKDNQNTYAANIILYRTG